MTRRIDFREWQRARDAMNTTQTLILAREQRPAGSVPGPRSADACRPEGPRAGLYVGRPSEGRPLRSHKPRSDDEWSAIADGVRALLAQRVHSGRWRWSGPRRLVVDCFARKSGALLKG